MRIESPNHTLTKQFGGLKQGEVFEYVGLIYIKMTELPVATTNLNVNAVCLATGTEAYFVEQAKVTHWSKAVVVLQPPEVKNEDKVSC